MHQYATRKTSTTVVEGALEIGNYDLDIGSGQAKTLGEGDATVTDAMGGIGQFDDL
eukprot:COSAG06_NODE_6268_length_3003_cov_8.358127_2_plen_56_part_00